VCASDRSCALNPLSPASFAVGDVQSALRCPSPADAVVGVWRRNELGQYRLASCPPGYTMDLSEFSNSSDRCNICPKDTYLLEETTSPLVACLPCPTGADCPGGSSVLAKPGYWQRSDLGGRRAGAAERRGGASSGRRARLTKSNAEVFQCQTSVCGDNNTCKNNRTGPVRLESFDLISLQLRLLSCVPLFSRGIDGRCVASVPLVGLKPQLHAKSAHRMLRWNP
jgi:hypothetical protein